MNNNYENNSNSKSRTNKNSRVEFAEDMNFYEQSNSKSTVLTIQIPTLTLIQILTVDSLILTKKQGPRTLFF